MRDGSQDLADLIWSVADLLRGDFRPSEYGSVLLPFTVFRRLECLGLLGGRSLVHRAHAGSDPREALRAVPDDAPAEPAGLLARLGLHAVAARLADAGLLPPVLARFAALDLGERVLSDAEMGAVFDTLVRRSAEIAADAGGDHFTAPDVTALLAALIVAPDADRLARRTAPVRVYDPVCGAGGSLMELRAAVGRPTPVELSGQDLDPASSALASATLLMHGLDPGGIALGDTLGADAHPDATFDYLVAAPPFGLEWKKVAAEVTREAALGDAGRFGAGLPRINDASLLFLQHLLAKMRPPEDGGSRLAVLFNSSPLFAGEPGTGESEIRRWILENDLLETVVALPERLLYHTHIPTYVWVLTNRKEPDRAGNVILMDCRRRFAAMRRAIADKSRYLTTEQISEIVAIRRSATATGTVAPDVATVVPVADFRFERVVGDVTRVGYEIRPFAFFSIALGDGYAPLSSVAEVLRPVPPTDSGRPLLTAEDLDRPDLSAADLDTVLTTSALTPCAAGDVVGDAGDWHLLPPGFGEAFTHMFVLRPRRRTGRALCEFLNAPQNAGYDDRLHPLTDLPVPAEILDDETFSDHLEDLRRSRADLARITAGILPNVFEGTRADLAATRRTVGVALATAALTTELLQPLEDPFWRAEYAYPFPIAALARHYRIAASPAQRKEALLKLGESVARTIGGLALAVLVGRNGDRMTAELRRRFERSATWGTWNWMIKDLRTPGAVPELPELDGVLDDDGTHALLTRALRFRNDSGHSFGVQPAHELEDEIARIEPVVQRTLESAGWLAQLRYDLVDRCEYTGTGFRLVGRRLRGGHPDWEPFERLVPDPVTPHRVYVTGPSTAAAIDLWPVAGAELCPTCRQWEFFVINQVHRHTATLRSGRDHEIDRPLT
ncbi:MULTISPECIES: N-6 DNA methylase [Catenuloplanes]|uniref:site-specific DNA-methyltransferase (adenine-specific) n=1 Tax=Catenuloplanes niger TaxID=587534 RepID=A0AAE3ZWI0_9ACTN|nr:N-6 DNA methylase [Catenuloplanes niger]MDR7327187.1 type I restriction-modification system DNA methylase subunit [Catenuloplanes niger]